jgi:NADH:ubiquinone reductase (non-electrogenic)
LRFYEAHCNQIDIETNSLKCTSALNGDQFTVSYDKLVIAVGAESNTFGVPGVKEHACFLKDISDARRIRQRLLRNLELASQPNVSDEERNRLLHFVVVGGGPTGVCYFIRHIIYCANPDLTA